MRTPKATVTKRQKAPSVAAPTLGETQFQGCARSAASVAPARSATHDTLVAEAAYYRAQQRGFEAGHELEDWLAAEAEVIGRSLQRIPTRVQAGLMQVGAMDPELQNSPVAQELDESSETIRQLEPGEPVCYFNGQSFAHDQYVSSGLQVLKCRYGVWVEAGSADRSNP